MTEDRRAELGRLSLEELRDLARRKARAGNGELPALTPRLQRGAVPLSFGQERLWFNQQLGMENSTYNLVYALRITGELDPQALEKAFIDFQGRHEILRTRFEAIDGAPVQRILPNCGLRIEHATVEGSTGAARDDALRELILDQQQRRFDLSNGDPLRAVLIREEAASNVLLIVVHHIVADGWSFNIILNELTALYLARLRSEPCGLPELEVQFADFALWQRRCADAPTSASQLDFWKRTLAGLEPLRLPADHARPAVPTYRGGRHPLWLPDPLSGKLIALAREQNVTLFMELLAIFSILLAKYSGQSDIAIGTVISGRPDVRTEALVGFFLNTLVIRVDLSDDPSFIELLKRVKEAAKLAYAHQDMPFERVVKELRPDRSLAATPLFQTTFTFANAPSFDRSVAGLEISRISDERSGAEFDLGLSMQAEDGRLAGVFEYSTDIFEAATVARMRDHFVRLAEQVASDPCAPLSALSLVTPEERVTLLHDWAAGEVEGGRERLVQDLISDQAARTPTSTAVADERERLSYAELDRRSNILAQRLIRVGVGPDDLVALYLNRRVELVVGILGILKAGGAYLPLDPAFFSERTGAILEEAAPRAIVMNPGALETAVPVVPIGDLGDRPDDCPGRPDSEVLGVGPANLAYVIYTSGSTGRPKGVALNHVGLSNLVRWCIDAFDFSSETQLIVATSCGFDLTQKNYFLPLITGGCVHLASEPFDPARICAQMARSRVSIIEITSSAFCALADSAIETGADLSSLRHAHIGGDTVNIDRLRPLGRLYPRLALTNSYGPTECTDIATSARLAPGWSETAQMPVPIGRPIPNTRCYVLDGRRQPVPAGIVGEIYIGGIGVGRGYLRRPDLTRERFLEDPHAPEAGARMYRTGDLGRWRADGCLEFLDRADRQVKVRGFRIELGDVEAELMRQPGIKFAAVVARGADGGDKRLSAYVVPLSAETDFSVSTLRKALAAKLPSYMVPSSITPLSEIPLTASGKLDRKALPEPQWDGPDPNEFAPPRSSVEKILVEIWSSVLEVTRIGVTDNPFDLGADSLLLLRVAARAGQRLGRQIALADFFKYPTIRDLAAFLESEAVEDRPEIAAAKSDAARRRSGRMARSRVRV